MTKRILFSFISGASGHQSAAHAIRSVMKNTAPALETFEIDTCTHIYPTFGPLIAKVYLELIRFTPQLWNFLYDNKKVVEATRELREIFNIFNTSKVAKILETYKPEAIVCTHAIPAQVLSSLKKRGKISLPIIAVITDFAVHAYWLSQEIDLYLSSTEQAKRDMIMGGIDPQKIIVTGIPFDPRFNYTISKKMARQKLKIHPSRKTVLIMGGSHGIGPYEEVMGQLLAIHPEIQLIVSCGYNNSLLKRLKKKHADIQRIRLVGFAHNLPLLMDAADLLITKPGGLTSSEALSKGLPMIILQPLPGQEERNAEYLSKNGAAVQIGKIDNVRYAVQKIFSNQKELTQLSFQAKSLGKPLAAQKASENILKLISSSIKPFDSERKRYVLPAIKKKQGRIISFAREPVLIGN